MKCCGRSATGAGGSDPECAREASQSDRYNHAGKKAHAKKWRGEEDGLKLEGGGRRAEAK